MNHKKVMRVCDNETMRVEEIIHLGGCVSGGSASGRIGNFLDDADNADLEVMFGQPVGDLPEELTENLDDLDVIAEHLTHSDRLGFLVNAYTPIMLPNIAGINHGGSYSWGASTFTWVYGESIKEAYNRAFVWVHNQRIKEKDILIRDTLQAKQSTKEAEKTLAKWIKKTNPFQL